MKKFFNVCKSVLSAVLLALPVLLVACILAARLSGGTPTLFGYGISIVITPSMEPQLPVGCVILSREYTGQTLEEGQIITYLGKEGSFAGKMVTHRIEKIEVREGETVLTTKGIANNATDPTITTADVRFVFVAKLVNLGKLYETFSSTIGFTFLVFFPMLLFILLQIKDLLRLCRKDKQDEESIESESKSRGESDEDGK